MNKKMFIICAIFALIVSCKNDATSKGLEGAVKDLESSEQNAKKIEQEIKKQVEGFLEILETKDLSKLDTKEIEKQIQELKEKVDKSDSKKTSIETYSGYEEKINKIKEKLKDKKELEEKLKELSESLKKKKEERKKALEDAKKKFEEFKGKVGDARGETHGEQARGQGSIGQQAFKCAQELGFKNMTSGGGDTGNMANEVITNSLKKIEEELKEAGEDKKE
ncbi:ErpL protein [Borreliella burgdorferi]|uniref:ErpL protein n=1 Tax=Borreliella burgdorferi TaxID=139 RepID=UPI001E43C272|nr:ErpL protein [Borreliella burgdorferi]MCD2372094.1 ErpL protein [Borreliella burgdorferi]MCD2374571.1 ErpL protein [Borreliella burgdorferi]MCD2375627.1 ErpL protein [Borreliella burgdorferi]MCD2385143.1 ErpL protein [Borreliella burgdorferi]MCD2393724.1 ErpL protein [Borreliella burgdorferi]